MKRLRKTAKKTRHPEWVRVSEAARRTGFSHTTIWTWAVEGRIPFTQPGGPGTALLVDFTPLKHAFLNGNAPRKGR